MVSSLLTDHLELHHTTPVHNYVYTVQKRTISETHTLQTQENTLQRLNAYMTLELGAFTAL